MTFIYRFLVLGVLGWAGATLESVRREVDVIKVQLADYKQSADDKVTVLKTDSSRHEAMIAEIRAEVLRARRSTPPKQTP